MANCEDCKLEERVRALETRDAVTQTQYANIMTLLAKLETAIEDLKSKPSKRWETIVNAALQWVVVALLGAVVLLK